VSRLAERPTALRHFQALGCHCEILLDGAGERAPELFEIARHEAERIESKFSRYRSGTVIDRVNAGRGEPIVVDAETADLLDYAARCYEFSDGLFDVTTGALRKVWRFEEGSISVDDAELAEARRHIGWHHVRWERPVLRMPKGFELDFGGIGKEYAADRILQRIRERTQASVLVNLGGDIAAAGTRVWSVGIENPIRASELIATIQLRAGAVATSGTAKRFATVQGRKLGHILNPKTGWPAPDAPLSVTVTGQTCTEAGFWSTLAMLQGGRAEAFLAEQRLESWCCRE